MSDPTRTASLVAAGLGAVLSPIPFADEVALLPLFGWLTVQIGKKGGLKTSEIPWRPLAKTAFTGLAVRGTLSLAVSFIPGVAAVANAASASALTTLYGRYAERACGDPGAAEAMTWKEILTATRANVAAPA